MSPQIQFAGLSPVLREMIGEISRQALVILEAQQALAERDAEIVRLQARLKDSSDRDRRED